MKKTLSVLLSALLALSLTACGEDKTQSDSDTSNDQSVSDTDKPNNEVSVEDPLEILTTVWGSYDDNEKFAAFGGDTSEENLTMDAPGRFNIADTDSLDVSLAFPVSSVEKIDNAASLVNMINVNTFTCGAYHVSNPDDIADVSASIKDNVMQRHWMCGFPEKLVIVRVGDCIVSLFGHSEPVDTFIAKLTAEYPSAETICDEPIEI